MSSGRFRVAIVLLLVVSACFAIVPLAGATDSGTVILPWVPNGDNTGGLGPWYGRIEIQNPSATLCSIKISVPSANGAWNANTQFIIGPHSLSDLAPGDIGLAAPGGAVMIDSSGCKAAVSVKQASTTFGDPPWSNGARAVTGYTGVPGEDTVNAPDWILPIVQTNNGWDSYIRVTNVEQFNTKNVTIQIFPYHNLSDVSGYVYSETISLTAGSTHTLDLLAALGQTGFVGFARITSTGNVVALVQREKPASEVAMINVASALPTQVAMIQSVNSYMLQAPIVFNAYNGWNTGINLANPTGAVANVTISYPGAGRPDDIVTLQPYASDYVYTPANASGQTGFTGNAVIYSDQPIGAIVDEVKYSTNDGISYSAVPGLGSQVSLPLVFKQSQSGTRNDNSGINVSNASDTQTTVEINIYNQQGGLAGGPYDLTIPAHSSNFIYLPTTSVPPDTLGTAIVTSLDDAPIVAVSNDVSYDIAGGGSAVFNAPSSLGLYQIGSGSVPAQ
ncbi:MAG TPA: hypothetical protein VNE17_12070 [Nitrolancea sp.]|nr:hypothetical protein [Nitrolancea sp.]